MPVITLTTDWNKEDFYIGAVKGTIYSQCENATVVDITHQIKPFNIYQAAFILKNTFRFYPQGTIHIIGVKTEAYKDHQYMAAELNGQYFLGTDNGLFSLLFRDDDNVNYVSLDYELSSFPVLDVFAKVACKLIQGEKFSILGKEVKEVERRVPLRATIDETSIIGSIVHIDSFQNAISNVSRDLFNRIGKERPFKIYVQSNHYVISKINNSYQETSIGELLAIFNSLNLLEVAINGGNAAELLNLDTNSTIRIKFR